MLYWVLKEKKMDLNEQVWQELLNTPTLLKMNEEKVSTESDLMMNWISSGNLDGVKDWIKKGGNINIQLSKNNQSLLIYAIQENQTEIVQLLLESGLKIDPQDTNIDPLWKKVFENNNHQLLDVLYQSGARPWRIKTHSFFWWNPEMYMKKHTNMVKYWLNQNYEPDFGFSIFFKENKFLPETLWKKNLASIWVSLLISCKDSVEVTHFFKKMKQDKLYENYKYIDSELSKYWEELIFKNRIFQIVELIKKGLYWPKDKYLSSGNQEVLSSNPPLPVIALNKESYKTLAWFLESPTLLKSFVQEWNGSSIHSTYKLARCSLSILKCLHQAGLDFTKQDPVGNTILHYKANSASEWDIHWKSWIEYLYPALEVCNDEGHTPLDILCKEKWVKPQEQLQKIQEEKIIIEHYLLEKLPKNKILKPKIRL